ncbi:putative legumain protein [Helianthus debilis subsp. tardiflorus]
MDRVFETPCGVLREYRMKHMRAFSNICNNNVTEAAMASALADVCGEHDDGQWSPLKMGCSA